MLHTNTSYADQIKYFKFLYFPERKVASEIIA